MEPTYSRAKYAGSIAALFQAGVGNVAPRSLFAALQSFAMGGARSGIRVLLAIGRVVLGVVGRILDAIAKAIAVCE